MSALYYRAARFYFEQFLEFGGANAKLFAKQYQRWAATQSSVDRTIRGIVASDYNVA